MSVCVLGVCVNSMRMQTQIMCFGCTWEASQHHFPHELISTFTSEYKVHKLLAWAHYVGFACINFVSSDMSPWP